VTSDVARWLLIAAAGAVGTLARFATQRACARFLPEAPVGTWLVNAIGCFVIAAIAGAVSAGARVSDDVRLAVTVGLCGGLTTYSSFNQEVLDLVRTGRFVLAVAVFGAMVASCFALGLVGYAAGRALATGG
jgi:CrcB protein